MLANNIDLNNVICHAPYIINLANRKDETKWEFSKNFLEQELKRCDELGIKFLVVHPGSAVGLPKEEALKNIWDALEDILKKDYTCQILLETMAGKGTECASTLEEMAILLQNHDKLGVCIDTCHLNDAGYNMQEFDQFLNEFATKIGLEKIRCVHINDSKNPLGSHKDRHANIGYGTIGFAALNKICHHEKLKNVPKILETPYVGETWEDKTRIYPPYKLEIESLRQEKFNDHLLEDIHKIYKR